MKWVVIILTVLTALATLAAVFSKSRVRHAEDNFDVAIFMLIAGVLGAIDFILIIIWLAIT